MSSIAHKAALLIAALAVPILTCWPGNPPASSGPLPANLDVIEPGRAYRSAQPSPEALAGAIELYGLRTVINLRGANPGQAWYDAERSVCDENGVTLVDHPMSAKSLPSPDLLRAIIDTLRTAEYPILIHCSGGADRTGAVAAIYRMVILGHDRADAFAELSPAHLHFRNLAPCMDTLIERFEPDPAWLDQYAAEFNTIQCTP